MEAPTSPVMPCKMELDKVMVSGIPLQGLWTKLGNMGLGDPKFLGLYEELFPFSQQLCRAGKGNGSWKSQPCAGG